MKDRGEDKDMVGRGEEACANDLTLSITKFTVFTLDIALPKKNKKPTLCRLEKCF